MSRARLLILVGVGLYVSSLQWIYHYVMAPTYSSSGMPYQAQSKEAFLLQCILAFLPAIWIPREITKPSHFQNWNLYLTVIVPSCIVPYHATDLSPPEIHSFLVLLILCFAGLCGVSSLPRLRIPTVRVSRAMFGCILAAFSLFVYGWLVFELGLPSLFLPIDQVYELRQELRGAHLPGLLGYLIFWQGMVVNPIITSLGFAKRTVVLIAMGTLLQIVLYNITSLKIFLLASVFQFGVCIFFVFTRRRRGTIFALGMLALVVGSSAWYFIDSHAIGPLLVLERWIFNSGQLSGYYLEFFSKHAHAGLENSSIPALRWLFPGPYELPIGQIIGREYFIQSSDGVYTNATAHFWADAYASFGSFGIVIGTIVAAGLLWLTDAVCRPDNRQFALMSFALVATSMAGQSVLTSILTGGLAPYLLLMIVAPSYPKTFCNPALHSTSTREKNRTLNLRSPSA